jgi:hypothetical protein
VITGFWQRMANHDRELLFPQGIFTADNFCRVGNRQNGTFQCQRWKNDMMKKAELNSVQFVTFVSQIPHHFSTLSNDMSPIQNVNAGLQIQNVR